MNIYIAICCDRHVDEDIRAFREPEDAIRYAKEFVPSRYKIEEQELTKRMVAAGWIYLAYYGTEGDSIRVETSVLK